MLHPIYFRTPSLEVVIKLEIFRILIVRVKWSLLYLHRFWTSTLEKDKPGVICVD